MKIKRFFISTYLYSESSSELKKINYDPVVEITT